MNDGSSGCLAAIIGMGVLFVMVGAGYCLGDTFSRAEHIELGRKKGIVFCNEKPKDCKYEFDYMQYLKTQQNQK